MGQITSKFFLSRQTLVIFSGICPILNLQGCKDNFEADDKTSIKTIRGDVEMMVINGVDECVETSTVVL